MNYYKQSLTHREKKTT